MQTDSLSDVHLDIETTGLVPFYDDVLFIGIYPRASGYDQREEITPYTGLSFLGIYPLGFPLAECACDRPANSTAILSAVDSIQASSSCRRTFSKFQNFWALRLTATIIEFPAIIYIIHSCLWIL